MTTFEIRAIIEQVGKKLSQAHLYRLFVIYQIKPLAERQRPQHYPPVVVDILKNHFGLAGSDAPPTSLNGVSSGLSSRLPRRSPARLIPLGKLKSIKRKVSK